MAQAALSNTEFRTLFREYAPFVWRVLRRHGVAESDLPDLCQEVFVVVHRKHTEFEGKSSLRTWIYGIAMRVAHGHRRLKRGQLEQAREELPSSPDLRTPEASFAAQRALDMLEQALSELSEEQREAFALFELEEMSVSEVADALGCPQATAFSRIRAARAALDAFMKRSEARAEGTRMLARSEGTP